MNANAAVSVHGGVVTHAPSRLVGVALAAVLTNVTASPGATRPVNLLPNAGFETADGKAPAFWNRRTPSDPQRTLSWDDQIRHTGLRSVKIENHASVLSRWRTGHLRDLSLEPVSVCRLSAWLRTHDVTGGARLRLYFMDAAGRIVQQPQSRPVAGTHDWSQVHLSSAVPTKTAYIMVYVELEGTGAVWYDDVVLTGTAASPTPKTGPPSVTIGAEDLDALEGYAPSTYLHRPVVELSAKAPRGRARSIFWGETARYDVAVTYVDESDGRATMRTRVNDREVTSWQLDQTPPTTRPTDVLRDHVIHGVDLQRRSRIVLEGEADGGEFARVHKITFRPVGRFQGKLLPEAKLRLPPTLRLYVDPADRRDARGMLARFVDRITTAATERRERDLAALQTPDQWRAWQRRTRKRLPEFFGDFTPKCPLNPQIVGKLDRPDYVIEKLIFESQPGYHCTANVYVPKRRTFPQPGVLFTCGHAADGKAYHLYHEACLGLVLKGYVVLALDPTGQGERSEYFDPQTGKPLVPLCVSHHHYLARPSWLVGRTLAGYRTWDCVRALDYLVSRPEIDLRQIAAVGNSGGGIMALLITAVDERIRVCAAAHPGGSMEQTYLTGRWLTEADVLALIPPRPCLIIVGERSGEEPGHRRKLENMLRFYKGLGAELERGQLVLVDGVHDMKRPKREAAYAWLNRWLRREEEGGSEPPLKPEKVADLNCTKTGYVLRDLGGESGQTLNAKVADKLRPPRKVPSDRRSIEIQRTNLRQRVADRIGLRIPHSRPMPPVTPAGEYPTTEGFAAKKLTIQTEDGIVLPALMLMPQSVKRRPVVLHAAERGKPTSITGSCLAIQLANKGFPVLSIDVRGAGETDPRRRSTLRPLTQYDAQQFRFDSLAVCAAQAKTTMLGMRAYDVVRATDYALGCEALSSRPVVLVGEGLGGVWTLAAAALDQRPIGVVCVGTVPSYKLIVGSKYYETRDYFWVAGALEDFDLPDLIGLVAPRPALMLDPVDAMLEPLEAARFRTLAQWPYGIYKRLGAPQGLQLAHTADGTAVQAAEGVDRALEAMVERWERMRPPTSPSEPMGG